MFQSAELLYILLRQSHALKSTAELS